jgi:uridine kinase
VAPARVVLVEGILLLADELIRNRLDLKLYVDTDADIRILRRLQRDMQCRERSFEQVRQQYFLTVRPMHLQFVEPSKRYADVIIPEGGYNVVALQLVVGRLQQLLQS